MPVIPQILMRVLCLLQVFAGCVAKNRELLHAQRRKDAEKVWGVECRV
jgi:hypothetical protein